MARSREALRAMRGAVEDATTRRRVQTGDIRAVGSGRDGQGQNHSAHQEGNRVCTTYHTITLRSERQHLR